MTDVAAVEAAIAGTHRREWARVLAATVRVARDLDLAEECVQDAYAAALKGWVDAGVPDNPGAWLATTARRRAIDAIRRDRALRSRLPLLVVPEETSELEEELESADETLSDGRLRLIFMCCHPALALNAGSQGRGGGAAAHAGRHGSTSAGARSARIRRCRTGWRKRPRSYA